MRRIVVGGVEYFWRHIGNDDWPERHGAEIVTADALVPGQHGRSFAFGLAPVHDREPGWWDNEYVTVMPRHIRRAIEIALRRRETGDIRLTSAEIDEVLERDGRIDVQLRIASDSLRDRRWPELVRAWLAIGCHGASDEVLDDWVACRDAQLANRRLQPLADSITNSYARVAYERRSALAFLLARCERVGIAHEVELDFVDAKLATLGKFPARPWGIPDSHGWWT